MSYDVKSDNLKTYYRAKCDYPDCGTHYEGDEYEYWETRELAAEDAIDNGMWLALEDWNNTLLLFCPKHLRLNERGYTLDYSFDNPDRQPGNPKLNTYYELDGLPIPRPECEQTILDLLEHPDLQKEINK